MTNQEKVQALLSIDNPLIANKNIAYSQNYLSRPANVGGLVDYFGNIKVGSNYIVGAKWYQNWMKKHGVKNPKAYYDARPGNIYVYDPNWDNVCTLSWNMLHRVLMRA